MAGAALASLLLHLLVVLPFLLHGADKKEEKKKAGVSEVSLLHVVDLVDKDVEGEGALHLSCPKTYEGIGIMHGWDGKIWKVAKGWPAHRAGIREGDVLVSTAIFPVNGYMDLEIWRGSTKVRYHLKTSSICFRDAPF